MLQAIVAHGGFDVGTLTMNTHLGGGPYTPIYFALKDLTKAGFVREISTGPNHDGSPRRGWSLTPSGSAAFYAATTPRLSRRIFAWLSLIIAR
ncbi:hypothetical protein [Beijerinckia sp. L45]|uniref:hypothetical protein n=1 Tax=Beijerinckia sp. L45 TaxID=1641855 RepID=UPI00131BFFC8|nr:hypothetical protein [Beijerinckia sp. L45]